VRHIFPSLFKKLVLSLFCVVQFGCLLVQLFGAEHRMPYSGFHINAVPFQITSGNMPPEVGVSLGDRPLIILHPVIFYWSMLFAACLQEKMNFQLHGFFQAHVVSFDLIQLSN
jgi:hypothetical protein